MNPPEEYVPIGLSCGPAWFLRKLGKRKKAYPFDWAVTPMASVYHLIKNNFEGFMEDPLICEPVHRKFFDEKDESDNPRLISTDQLIYPVICSQYNVLFPHHFTSISPDSLLAVKGKIDMRVQRLRSVLNSPHGATLVYQIIKPNSWQAERYEEQSLSMKIFNEEENLVYVNKLQNLLPPSFKFIELKELRKLHNI